MTTGVEGEDSTRAAMACTPVRVTRGGRSSSSTGLDGHHSRYVRHYPNETVHIPLAEMRPVEKRDYVIDSNWRGTLTIYLEG
jgi:hypothetical protein